MEKIVSFDKQGRIYLPEELRAYLRFKIMVARATDRGIFLEPIEEDPIEALAQLGKHKLKKKTVKQLKEEARKEIEDAAVKKVRRH
jgi:bifunctional DNA-binding transcriptional regulator/antitoxin component of YhaV-PrlF toxin-antitoxin module